MLSYDEQRDLLMSCRTNIGVASLRLKTGAKNLLWDGQVETWEAELTKLKNVELQGIDPVIQTTENTLQEIIDWARQPGNNPDPIKGEEWNQVSRDLTTFIVKEYKGAH
jgi:hypothetical protein